MFEARQMRGLRARLIRRGRRASSANVFDCEQLETRRLLSGTFAAPVPVFNSSNQGAVVTGDFNGDGIADIATANRMAGTVSVLLGKGDGTFQPPLVIAAGTDPETIATGDFNGDGITDLVTGGGVGNCVTVLLGNGDGTFGPATNYPAGQMTAGVAVGDFNHDGKPDIVADNSGDNTSSVLLGNGDGTFQSAISIATGAGPDGVSIGDFNGDGNLDFVTADYSAATVTVHLGNGDGTFSTGQAFATDVQPLDVVAGDFNNDGVLDLATANNLGTDVCVLLGNGDGTFQFFVKNVIGTNPAAIAEGDVNGDGSLDLITANANNGSVGVLLNNGNGTFQAEQQYAAGNSPDDVAVADFNGDGQLDIAASEGASTLVGVLLTQQASVISQQVQPTLDTYGQPVQISVTVSAAAQPSSIVPGGTVTFMDGNTPMQTVPLNAVGTAIFAVSTLLPGVHSISTVYNGDSRFTPSSSSPFVVTVQGPPSSVTSLTPGTVSVGNPGFSIGVIGSNFTPNSIVTVDGSPRPTTFASANVLTAILTSADFAFVKTLLISVTDPSAGGSATPPFPLNVVAPAPVPVLLAITPNSLPARSPSTTLNILGQGFTATSTLLINGIAHAATFLSTSSLSFTLTATDLSSARTLAISILTAGKVQSNTLTFAITGPTLIATARPINVKAAATFSGMVATFTDGSLTTLVVGASRVTPAYAATITWGDGTTSGGTVKSNGAGFVVSGSHVYTTAGAYAFRVKITKLTGDSATATAAATIALPAKGSQQFAALAYQVLLDRLITPAELRKVSSELDSGLTHFALVLRIESTKEYKAALIRKHFQQGVGGARPPAGVPSANHLVKARRDYHRLQALLLATG